MTVDDAIKELRDGKGNLRCRDFARVLESLGFHCKPAKRNGKHITVTHPDLSKATSGAFTAYVFNGGHGANDVIRNKYYTGEAGAISLLKRYETQLKDLGYG